MTLFEALKFNREPLEMLMRIGGRQNDVRYIDLYDEYRAMKAHGEKMTYIAHYLAEKYSISVRKVYELVKRFGRKCTLDAV